MGRNDARGAFFSSTGIFFEFPQILRVPTERYRLSTTNTESATALRVFWQDSVDRKIPGAMLLLIRFVIGPMFIGTGMYWMGAEDATGEMSNQIRGVVESGRTVGWYVPFLEGWVLPNVGLFAFLVTWGEFLTGVSLTFGAATRLGAAVGIFMAANYALLYNNDFFPAVGNWNYVWYLTIVLLAAGGRSFGVDTYLARRWPRCPLW